MGTAAKLAIPLYVGDPAQHAGATFVSGMDEDELLDGVPSTPARIASLDPDDTHFVETFALPGGEATQALPAGLVGLAKTNLTSRDSILNRGAQVRFTLLDAASSAVPARRPPSSITTTTYSGAVGDVDESPFAIDANDLSMSGTAASHDVRFNFPVELGPLDYKAGARAQMFVMEHTFVGGATGSIAFELWESGGKVADLEDVATRQTAVDGLNITYRSVAWFDAADLSGSTNGSQVKLIVSGLLSTGDHLIHAAGLYPHLNFDPALIVSAVAELEDSGWLDAIPDVIDDALGDLPANYVGEMPSRNTLHWPTSIVEDVVGWQVQIRDPFNVDGYIDIGEMLAGARFEATINRDLGKLVDLKPLGTKTITAGGKHVGVAGKFLRSIHMPLSWMTPAEGAALMERILRMNTLAPVAISLHSGSASEARILSCYGSLGVAPEYAAPYALHRGTTVVVDEEL